MYCFLLLTKKCYTRGTAYLCQSESPEIWWKKKGMYSSRIIQTAYFITREGYVGNVDCYFKYSLVRVTFYLCLWKFLSVQTYFLKHHLILHLRLKCCYYCANVSPAGKKIAGIEEMHSKYSQVQRQVNYNVIYSSVTHYFSRSSTKRKN